jgi:aminopeptidase N
MDSAMSSSATHETLLSDYTPPEYFVDRVRLDIDIRADHTRVSSQLKVRRNPKSKARKAPLFLDGENQRIISVVVDGKQLAPKDYKVTAHGMSIAGIGDKAVVEVMSTNDPHTNTALSGLYASGRMFCTQCEAQGFRFAALPIIPIVPM